MSLEVLHVTTAEDGTDVSLIDVVAIHGLDEDENDTWTDPSSGVNWLKELLPFALNGALQARIFTYGYKADTSILLGSDSANGILQQAHNLVNRLQVERSLSNTPKRPLIFICHGFGGIIVKRALAFSATQVSKKVTHNYSIYISTFGLLFLGTPHSGLQATFIQSITGLPYDTDQFELVLKRQHDVLQNIADMFAPLAKQFHILFFWEQVKTKFGNDYDYVVGQESAAPIWNDTEQCGLYANHRQMCKFNQTTSSGFKIVISALLRYSQAAQASIVSRWRNANKYLATQRSIEASELIGFNVHKNNELFMYFNSPRNHSFEVQSLRNKYYHVPHSVSNIFTGQGRLYDELRHKMLMPQNPDQGLHKRVFVLYGMGGSGKTQFCLKFIQDHRDNFWAVFWVDASSEETAERALSDIGRIGGLGETYQAGMYWLTGLSLPWMLVIDNADDPLIDYSRFFPAGDSGHILITSRLQDCKIYATVGFHEFRDMDEEDAITLLLRAADEPVDAPDSRNIAKPIVRTLGYLPLALIQAGASIRQRICTLADYLALYDSHSLDMMKGRLSRSPDAYRNSVYTTWEVTVCRIEEEDSETATDAIQVLQVLAFLHFEQVPISLFERAWNNLQRWPESLPPEPILCRVLNFVSRLPILANLFSSLLPESLAKRQRRLPLFLLEQSTSWNSFRFQAALVMLEKHSLIYRDVGEHRTYSMHPMVHSWARERLQGPEQELLSDIAMNTIATSITTHLQADQQRYRIELIPHINAFFKRKHSMTLLTGAESDYSVSKSIKFAGVYSEGGFWKEASHLQERIVEIWRSKDGFPSSDHLEVMIALADSFWNLDRLVDSLRLLSEVVQISTSSLGKENPTTLRAMDKLAGALWLCGRRNEAKILSEEAVSGFKKSLEPDHPHTLDAMDNLGRTLMHLDRAHEAEELHRKVLDGRKKLLGVSHPDTLMAMANLGMDYHALKDLDQAEDLLELVLRERSAILGEEHPYTLWAINDLSKIRADQGRPVEAEGMLTGILDTVIRSLGSEHVGMMMTKFNLAHAYFMQERWVDSERLLLEVIELQKKKHVPAEHADSIGTRLELAKVTKHLGRLNEAEMMFRDIVQVADRVHGPVNFISRSAMGQLAAILIARGQLEEADQIEATLRQSC